MPLNDKNHHALEQWLRQPAVRRDRLEFWWELLNNNDKDTLKARVKADLDAAFDSTTAAIAARKLETTGGL